MIRSLLDTLFPPRCLGCGTPLIDGEKYICLRCLSHLPRSFYHLRPDSNPMIDRFAGVIPFEKSSSLLLYSHNSLTGSIIQDFKYRGMPDLARRMGALMAEELTPSGFFSDIDRLMPMAQHWTRRLKRGYNQTEQLAIGISGVTGIPVAHNLRAYRRHKTQTRMSLTDRRANPRGSFMIRNPETLSGLHLLLLDDVCTTGATMLAAAETLLSAVPDCRISILTLASTV